jgi:hypothetical protein
LHEERQLIERRFLVFRSGGKQKSIASECMQRGKRRAESLLVLPQVSLNNKIDVGEHGDG